MARNATLHAIARADEDALTRAIITLASQYGRYGYRRITALLQRGRLAGRQGPGAADLATGGAESAAETEAARTAVAERRLVRAAPAGAANHVWSYDFVSAQTHDGRTLRLLTLIDEYTRECLAIRVARRLSSQDVIETLADVMLVRGIPEHIRSDNGPEMTAKICASGWPASGPRRCTSNQAVPGRTATARASTASCGMSSEWRNLLHPEGGADRDRAVAQALQHRPAALVAGLSATSAADFRAARVPSGWAPAMQ